MGVPCWEDRGGYVIDRGSYLSTIRLNRNEVVALFVFSLRLSHSFRTYFLEVSRSKPASYVIAHDDLSGALRTFKLERVVAAEILEESYAIPDDFDPYVYLSSAWGVMDEVEVEVRLRFSPAVASRVKESVWHHSQRTEDMPDGGCELTMRVGGIKEVRAWVLGWGGDVEVLAPPSLRDEVRAQAQRMLERYQ